MSTWYKDGTVSVTNGSTTVTGSGTAFVANVRVGEEFRLEGASQGYEIAAIVSNTQLTLARDYLGSTLSGQDYVIVPVRGVLKSAYDALTSAIATMNGHINGALSGLFSDGTQSLPGISFKNDPDTGLRRAGSNDVALVAGGADKLRMTGNTASGDVVQSSQTDNTAGKLLKVGAFGLGSTSQPIPGSDIDDYTMPTGMYTTNEAGHSGTHPRTGFVGVLYHHRFDANAAYQVAYDVLGQKIAYKRAYTGGGGGSWSAWVQLDVTSGSSANGEYVRFPDGTQICWADTLIDTSLAADTYTEVTWTFPAAFLSGTVPKPVVTARSLATAGGREDAARYLRPTGGTSGASSCLVGVYNAHASAVTTRADAMAIGRWF